jgi:polysaccharide biosynthesis transport protein
LPPNAGEFLSSVAVAEILQELQARFDYLLVDTPPMIHMSDAMTITRNVDAIIVVARLGEIRRQRLEQLRRSLTAAPAVVVGLVITAAQSDAAAFRYDYGYEYASYSYGHANGATDGAGSKGRVRRRLRAG